MNKIILILAVCVLVSCEEAAVQAPVQSSFEGEFLKRKRGLKSLLSDRFTVLDTKNNTSQYYQLAFDVDSRQNYLLDGNSGDTLDSFVCLRNRSLWYLIRPNLDSAYTIQALEMRADTILGWNQSYDQMKAVDERVGRVEFSMDTLNSRHALIADKHAVRSLFGQILEQSEARYIIASQGDPERVRETDVPEQEMTADNQEIFVLYPNPASSFVELTFEESGDYFIELMSMDGQIHYENQLKGEQLKINVEAFTPGMYICLIKNLRGEVLSSRKLLIEG